MNKIQEGGPWNLEFPFIKNTGNKPQQYWQYLRFVTNRNHKYVPITITMLQIFKKKSNLVPSSLKTCDS